MPALVKIVLIGFPSALAFWLGSKLMVLGMNGLEYAAPEARDTMMENFIAPILQALKD